MKWEQNIFPTRCCWCNIALPVDSSNCGQQLIIFTEGFFFIRLPTKLKCTIKREVCQLESSSLCQHWYLRVQRQMSDLGSFHLTAAQSNNFSAHFWSDQVRIRSLLKKSREGCDFLLLCILDCNLKIKNLNCVLIWFNLKVALFKDFSKKTFSITFFFYLHISDNGSQLACCRKIFIAMLTQIWRLFHPSYLSIVFFFCLFLLQLRVTAQAGVV